MVHHLTVRDVACHMGSHSVTCHSTQANCPALTPAMQAGTRFTYPRGMEGRVDLDDLIAPGRELKQLPFDRESDAEPLHHQDNHSPSVHQPNSAKIHYQTI